MSKSISIRVYQITHKGKQIALFNSTKYKTAVVTDQCICLHLKKVRDCSNNISTCCADYHTVPRVLLSYIPVEGHIMKL